MENRAWLRDEPSYTTTEQPVPYAEYLRIIMHLMFLSLFTGATLFAISQLGASNIWVKIGFIHAWSLFGLAGLLLTDLIFKQD